MGIFGGKSKDKGDDKGRKRDLRKAQRFFQHAETVADARNYDYAIELYCQGLWHVPDQLVRHEALYDVALKRKVAGGKPAGMFESGIDGSDPVAKFVTAEKKWAKDPLNLTKMLDVMKKAVLADQQDEELNIGEVAFWVGSKILEGYQDKRNPSASMFVELCDLFAAVDAFDEAVDACKVAIELAPASRKEALEKKLRDLEADAAMITGGYGEDAMNAVRDKDGQDKLNAGDAVMQASDKIEQLINSRRLDWADSPDDPTVGQKLFDALMKADNHEADEEACAVMMQLFEKSGNYKFKVEAGDTRMRQMARRLRRVRDDLKAEPDDEGLKTEYKKLSKERLEFELAEYKDRVENYPTDNGLKYEYGKRLFASKNHEEAMLMFQESQADPKHRAQSLYYLGQCFMAQEFLEEAIESYRKGINAHGKDDDQLALDMRYRLMDALEKFAIAEQSEAEAKEALNWASKVLQTNVNFRDIRDRMAKLRELVKKLRG